MANNSGNRVDAAVVGGGMAGLAAARTLQDAGMTVEVFDRGHQCGGRVATRTFDDARFNYGAQYFTARDRSFVERVERWQTNGVVETWRGRLMRIDSQTIKRSGDHKVRYVGVGGMQAIILAMAEPLIVHIKTVVGAVTRRGERWLLRSDEGNLLAEADRLIIAMPPRQAARLLPASHPLVERALPREMQPTWTLMVQWPAEIAIPFDAAFIEHPALSWMMRAPRGENAWTIHSTHQWAEPRLQTDREQIAADLLREVSSLLEIGEVDPLFRRAHRWSFAAPTRPPREFPRSLVEAEERLALAGDWCVGPRVEGAYLSGVDAAEQLLEG